MSEDQIAGLMRGPAGTEVMLGLERRRKYTRELKYVVLTRQLPTTFAPDFSTVSCQRHHGESQLVNAHLPHLRSAREHVRNWTDSLALLLQTQQNTGENCPDPHHPSGTADLVACARNAGLPPHSVQEEGCEDEAELREMRSHFLQLPRTYLVL